MLDHINLTVPNINETAKFYTDVLGFTVTGDFNTPSGRFLFVSKDGVTYEILENATLTAATVGHIALKSTDIEADYQALKAQNAKLLGPVKQIDFIFNGAKFFFVESPSGEQVEYIQLL
ncbi:VOC family protein [Candidatus Epulonipiscium viviparus]|uniref:VOC family protein n=1 Tax=Candidatus Epulonipiscium viviparus TaxID=420336 RepID=UPI00016C0A37|nr:VOC family protein [Candidatus Epulopiscium viviparus]